VSDQLTQCEGLPASHQSRITYHLSLFTFHRLCGDLWNLLPAHRSVNQNQKSDRLPSAERLTSAKEIIVDWWTTGYVQNTNPLIGQRFITEARASLPGFIETPSTETIFEGLELQRIRLHHDQQIPEW
jgi:hypothetical protein